MRLIPAISVELLSGNTPLAAYFSPLTFVILNLTYGGPLLLIRKTVARWGKGFASVLIFAAGYGMVNEAIETRGFFDPHFYAVTAFGLEDFGRAFGINVAWVLHGIGGHTPGTLFGVVVMLVILAAAFFRAREYPSTPGSRAR